MNYELKILCDKFEVTELRRSFARKRDLKNTFSFGHHFSQILLKFPIFQVIKIIVHFLQVIEKKPL